MNDPVSGEGHGFEGFVSGLGATGFGGHGVLAEGK